MLTTGQCHNNFSPVKNPPPAMQPLIKTLRPLCYLATKWRHSQSLHCFLSISRFQLMCEQHLHIQHDHQSTSSRTLRPLLQYTSMTSCPPPKYIITYLTSITTVHQHDLVSTTKVHQRDHVLDPSAKFFVMFGQLIAFSADFAIRKFLG